MPPKTTRTDVESMFARLIEEMGVESGLKDGQYYLEWQGQRCRIARAWGEHGGISVPFLNTWLAKREASDMFWFAARAIELSREGDND